MATIGSLIIEIAGDNSRLRRSFRESSQLTQQYQASIVTARREFASSAIRLREDLFSGALSPAAFKAQGVRAAKEYNTAVLTTISELRNAGALTERVHASLVNELRDAGLASGKSFLEGMQSSLSAAGTTLKSIGRTLTVGLSLPLAAAGGFAFKQASDAAEEANAFRVTFGPLADEVQTKLNQLHRTIPVTNTQLQQLAGNFGALLLPMGIAPQKAAVMSARLVELAGDIQSLRNIPFNEVVQRLTSGLVGETEAVRRLGANIGETALKQEALRLGYGKNIAALTGAQKAQAVYNILLRDTKLATGDAENTMASAANQIRFAQRNFQELAVTIGTQLVPILTPLVTQFSSWLEKLKQADKDTIGFALKLGGIAIVAGPVITALGAVASGLGLVLRGVIATRTAIAEAGGLTAAVKAFSGVALLGPAGMVLGLVAASIALVTWLDRLNDSKRGVKELQDSVTSLSRAQLSAEISRRAMLIGGLQRDALTAPLVAADNTGDGRVVRTRTQIQEQIRAESDELRVLTQRWQDLTKPEAEAADMQARQLAIWKQTVAEAAKMAAAGTPVSDKDAAAKLEQHLSQLTQTREAIKAVGGSTLLVDRLIVGVWDDATKALHRHGDALDDVGLRLTEILTKAGKATGMIANLSHLPGVQVTGNNAFTAAAASLRVAPAQFAGVNSGAFSPQMLQAAGFSIPAPQAAKLPAGPSVAELRWRVALAESREALVSFGGALRGLIVGGFMASLRSIAGQLNPFSRTIQAINEAAAPLAPIMETIARVVADDLAPVFKAFEPVLQQLIPVIDAVLRVFAPIVAALAPIIGALIPILKALFPIIKQGAIVATYLFQAFALGASIFIRAIGNIVIGFGTIIKALAVAIDKLPFVSARGAIDAAQGIIDFGRALLASSDEFKKSAEEMAKARDDIRDIQFEETAGAVDALGEAAQETADALRNVPTWWKSAAAIWEATHARGGISPGGSAIGDPVGVGGSTLTFPTSLGGTGGGGGGGGGGGDGGTDVMSVNIENVNFTQPVSDARLVMRQLIDEAQRLSQATFGTTARWSEVM